MSALTNVLETVLVLASPITQEEQVSKDGEETVYLSRAQLDALNARFAVPLDSFSPFDGEIYVSAENLTNTDYAYYPGYPMPGIMWYVGCKFKF